jgi:hypothetical protein
VAVVTQTLVILAKRGGGNSDTVVVLVALRRNRLIEVEGNRAQASQIGQRPLEGIVSVIISSVKISATFPLTWNRANSAMVRSTMSLALETMIDFRLKQPNQCRWRL